MKHRAWPSIDVDDVKCPLCGARPVQVEERESYYDGGDYEAFCTECDSDLRVWAKVQPVTFHSVELEADDE